MACGPDEREILGTLKRLRALGLVRAAHEVGPVLRSVRRLDAFDREPERYGFLTNEGLRPCCRS